MKKALILTYYWPPCGGVPVQRWVKMARHLRSFGWEPVIYTALNGEMPVIDETLEATLPDGLTVVRRPINEPYSMYKRLTGLRKEDKINAAFLQEKKKSGRMHELAVWIRGNFFIPDARKFWIRPSVNFLIQYLKKHPVDAIISTGPPHTMHMIAMGLAKNTGLPWVADFRDPWTKIDYYHELHLSKRADRLHHKLENEVLNTATKVVTVSRHWADDFNSKNNGNTVVITNGFDERDFSSPTNETESGFVLHHVGMINKARNPELFWKAVRNLCDSDVKFNQLIKIRLTGKTDFSVQSCIEKYQLQEKIIKTDHVDHATAIAMMRRSPVLLLLLNDTQDILGRIPAKVFEYLAARRPILAVGNPEGDAAEIIISSKAGEVADLNDLHSIQDALRKLFDNYLLGKLFTDPENIQRYSGAALAKNYADLLNSFYHVSDKN